MCGSLKCSCLHTDAALDQQVWSCLAVDVDVVSVSMTCKRFTVVVNEPEGDERRPDDCNIHTDKKAMIMLRIQMKEGTQLSDGSVWEEREVLEQE